MKVNSRSAAHGEYECLQDSEYSSGVRPPRWAAFSPGTRGRREEATHCPPPGREQLPRISHQAWGRGGAGETAQWLDNTLASNSFRDAFVSTSSIHAQTPAPSTILTVDTS